jgi:homogentisate 1,2-dioxygenase
MPFYHKLGEIPRVKHTTFYKEDGKELYREELVSSKGFSGIYSTLYHHHLPSATRDIREVTLEVAKSWGDAPVVYTHCNTDQSPKGGDYIHSREKLLENAHCIISTARVSEESRLFYRNARASELIFVHHGAGSLKSSYGVNSFGPGDQIVVPKGTIYSMDFVNYDNNKLLIVESAAAFDIPKHFRNEYGQLTEDAPYSERDFRPPEYMEPLVESGDFKLLVKMDDQYAEHILPHHPFDVVGWDGYLYPFTFNIKDYHPKVGRIHLPPPVHLLFTTGSFVICNFVPRPFDFHEAAIPAPYFHNNIDSDEVLYYLDGDFMSRKGVSSGSLTWHPGGIPHGPQPGRTEASVGVARTDEYAFMIDTFEPLKPTMKVKECLDDNYPKSWL